MSVCKKNIISLVVAESLEQKRILVCKVARDVFSINESCESFCAKFFSGKINNSFFVSCHQNYKLQDIVLFEQAIYLSTKDETPFLFVVDDVDKMNALIANRFLKKLEELSENIHFVFSATNEEFVLKTIRSRCNFFLSSVNVPQVLSFEENSALINFFSGTIELKKMEDLDLILKEIDFSEHDTKIFLEKILQQYLILKKPTALINILTDSFEYLPQISSANFYRYLFLRLSL